jgi:hypothetical protein
MGGPERPDQPDGPPPFGKDDNSTVDVRLLQRELENTRKMLQSVQTRLTQMRYKPGPDQQVPEVREITRIDGQWPFLLIRTYPGDVGKRPIEFGDVDQWVGWYNSPDVIVTEPGPRDEPKIVERDGIAALKEREQTILWRGETYDIWVHVWNLGQSQVSGVRVRVRRRPFVGDDPQAEPELFLGGTTLDLGDRLSEHAHRVVRAATFTVPVVPVLYRAYIVATADTLSDPSTGDLSLGADRHTAYRFIYAYEQRPPQFG